MSNITFAEGIEVYYRGIHGVVDFICENTLQFVFVEWTTNQKMCAC